MQVICGLYGIEFQDDGHMDDGRHHRENEDWQKKYVAPPQCTTSRFEFKVHEKISLARWWNNVAADSRIVPPASWP